MKKNSNFLVILFIISGFLISCSDSDETVNPIDYRITIEPTTASIMIGDQMSLRTMITPEPVETLEIIWSSDDEDLATVDSQGLVTAIAEGNVRIVAELRGFNTAGCDLTITAEEIPPVSNFTITFSDSEVNLLTEQIKRQHAVITPTPNIPLTIFYKSDNSSIATINSQGAITALSPGVTTVHAYFEENGQVGGVADCVVNVELNPNRGYKYRVILKDKTDTEFSIASPQRYLSQRAIERRQRQSIPIEESDLPVSQKYLDELKDMGVFIAAKSKWLNSVVVHHSDVDMEQKLEELPFVEKVELVWQQTATLSEGTRRSKLELPSRNSNQGNYQSLSSAYYGDFWRNIELMKGQTLHDMGFMGEGIEIAVIDASFSGYNSIAAFRNTTFKEAKSFIFNKSAYTTSSSEHGTNVLSVMAANSERLCIGTAPKSSYWLFRSEDMDTEYPVEQDYWLAALEYADSVGVDIVNTSLGYWDFDHPVESLRYEDSDGKTFFMTRGANMGAQKGMLLVNAAGNSGGWVGTASDSEFVLTVGGVDINHMPASFGSYGMTSDGRIKPDVVALAVNARVLISQGASVYAEGTSFASPAVCGLAACLWEAYPNLKPLEIIEIFRKSADRAESPVLPYGYGIPDMEKAFEIAKSY